MNKIKTIIATVLMTLLLVSSAAAWINPIFPPITPPINQPAHWEDLQDQSIAFNSPDGTVVYSNIYSMCSDPDDPEYITLTSFHSNYNLAISNTDIVISNLRVNYIGTETVQLSCNGIPASFQLTIFDNNQAPVAIAGPDRTVAENTAVSFDGSGSYDPDGSIVSYTWNFGDGSSQTGSHVTHSFCQEGTYLVTLTVMDNLGKTGQDTLTVIADGVPTAVAGGPYSGVENTPILFDASQSTDDTQIVLYHWDWGDGWQTDTTNAYTYHTYVQEGDYTVVLTVTDNLNLQNSDSTSAHVVEQGVIPPDPDPDPEPEPVEESTESKSERIIFNKVRYNDYVAPDDIVEFKVAVFNDNSYDLEDVSVSVHILDLEVRKTAGPFDIDSGETETARIYLDIPADAEPGNYDVRIVSSNDNFKRIEHRIITVI